MADRIFIEGIDKAALLAALYNNAAPLGLGWLQARSPLSIEEAQKLLEETQSFDYLYGRPLKISLDGDERYTRLYDRDNGGDGTAARIIESLRVPA